MVRGTLLALAASESIKKAVISAPGVGGVVTRFAAGESDDDAVRATRDLQTDGFSVTLDYLGEDTTDRAKAARRRPRTSASWPGWRTPV